MSKKPTYEQLEELIKELEQSKSEHIQAYMKSLENENLFKTVMDQSPLAIEIYDLNGRLLRVNDAWEPFWNMKKSDMANFNILNDPECEKTGLTSVFKKALQDISCPIPPSKYHPEESGFKDGSIRWINSKIYPIKNIDGKIKNIVLVMEDITALKETEDALQKVHDEQEQCLVERTAELRESNARLQAILDHSPALISIKDVHGNIIMVNNRFSLLDGPSPEEYVGQSVFDLFPKDIAEKLWENDLAALDADAPTEVEETVKHKDGTWHSYLTVKFPVYIDTDNLFGVCAISTDITERIQAEEDLLKERTLLKSIIENIPVMLTRYNPDANMLYLNKEFEKKVGWTTEEVQDIDMMEKVYPDPYYRQQAMDYMLKASLEWREFTVMSKSGEPIDSEWSNFRMEDGTQIGIGIDITERKKMEARLLQAQKMESIGTLAGGIAHDFNNILHPIIGFTELSMKDLPKTHEVQENLQDILEGAKRARDLVKQILLFARQEKQVLKPTILKPVVQEAMKLMRSSIPANIDIQSHLSDQEDYIMCDSTEIHEIVMNLCTNAYHSMEENGGTIIVSLNKQNPPLDLNLSSGEYICLSVSDSGVGIPKDIIDKIFEPYLTTKEIGKGSGLGLSVVHGIVTNYEGDISVESSSGKGTVFNVFLPVTTQSIQLEQKLEKDTPQDGTENILFVDDEPSIVKLAKRILERLGYTMTGKTSCTEAFELFKHKPDKFDLVITDMAMPIMTGTEFAKKILKIQPEMPIIICTGFSEKLDPEIAKSIGIKEYIKKPILIDELTSKIRQVLDQSSKG